MWFQVNEHFYCFEPNICNFEEQHDYHNNIDQRLILLKINMNMKSISEAVSDGGMSARTAAAVGGGTAGGLILLLSLLALCCCWGRHFSRPKHPQVHVSRDRSGDKAWAMGNSI